MKHPSPAKKEFKLTFAAIVSIGLFAIACLGFVAIADEMVIENENQLDRWVFSLLAPLQSSGTTQVMSSITFFGSFYFLFPAYCLIVLVFWLRKQHRYAINIAAVAVWTGIIVACLKAFFHRQRPPDPLIANVTGFSFPSGHSFSAFTFFGLLVFLVFKTGLPAPAKWCLAVLLFALAVTVAFSRVYLHVHYASDVAGGFLLAIVWLMSSFFILKKIDERIAAQSLR
jgi:undecaprenyl-diphosphatase